MATAKSKLLQNLDYFWNQYWSNDPRIKLIICGSSASWILNKVIKDKGGLHNRVTHEMKLEPFTLNETRRYLRHNKIRLTNKHILLIYMVTGGVPFYLSKITWRTTAHQIIENLAFKKNSFLLGEFDKLFASLFKNHQTHVSIVRELATSRDGIGKRVLMEKIGSAGGSFSAKLQELEDAGFITSFKPLYNQVKGVYYRLTDEYSHFYLRWLEPIKSQLKQQAFDEQDWQALQQTPQWHSWLGYAFESVCYKHIINIKRKLDLPAMSLSGAWRYIPQRGTQENGAQIDMLFDRQDDAITICEIKYSDKPFVIKKDYASVLQNKLHVFKKQTGTGKQLLLSMICANGLSDNPYSDELVCGLVTLDDLFKAKHE